MRIDLMVSLDDNCALNIVPTSLDGMEILLHCAQRSAPPIYAFPSMSGVLFPSHNVEWQFVKNPDEPGLWIPLKYVRPNQWQRVETPQGEMQFSGGKFRDGAGKEVSAILWRPLA